MGMLLRGGRGEIGGLKGGSLLFSKGVVTLKGSRVGVGGTKKTKTAAEPFASSARSEKPQDWPTAGPPFPGGGITHQNASLHSGSTELKRNKLSLFVPLFFVLVFLLSFFLHRTIPIHALPHLTRPVCNHLSRQSSGTNR